MQQYAGRESICFMDTEVDPHTKKVLDIGAVRTFVPVRSAAGQQLHTASLGELERFLRGSMYVCGHNIINFDLKYTMSTIEAAGVRSVIDTLFWSPLLFPKKPYHNLLKDDKLQVEELNNPLNDSVKALELFLDEVAAFNSLSISMKKIYCTLLEMIPQFRGFFRYLNFHEKENRLTELICAVFQGKICENAPVEAIAKNNPVELAYCLAAIDVDDRESIIPRWVLRNFPKVQDVYLLLRGTPCRQRCPYCGQFFDVRMQLKKKFGFDKFREYNGKPLQQEAVEAAVQGKSLLAVFPTGGGKSITFQLPALIASETARGLTVVISPLQSLMKDQVDNLRAKGIADAVTINGLLNAIERAEALERVENGIASLLYIAPESLRSKTIERLLGGRNITRFVIDEAHCFSSWGQDFRVDYLYIGDFIAKMQEIKQTKIPVSCFTATAKQKVISDIREYFQKKLNIHLDLFTTDAARSNLRYEVLYRENDAEKYTTLRSLIEQKDCPTICYVSRTKKAEELAERLCKEGFEARPFHGKMDSDEKIANQEAFIRGEVQIIVATSAFGMGVDKKDVRLVIHYDISDSLENYVQEAGRAGRDENIQAECYVLFHENDLDKHFLMLNRTKLSISEIQQIWRGIKNLTKGRNKICCSALELARRAGWEDSGKELETKVRTAVSALEIAGYIKRGQNCPRVYADSIQVKTAKEATQRIQESESFDEKQKEYAVRIIKKLISKRSRSGADNAEAESRVDYIADELGIEKTDVIESINIMRQEGLLSNDRDMCVFVEASAIKTRSKATTLSKYARLEDFLIRKLQKESQRVNYKALNEEALNEGIKSSTVNSIRSLFYFWVIKGYIRKPQGEISTVVQLTPAWEVEMLKQRYEKRIAIAEFIENFFIERAKKKSNTNDYIAVDFSILELKRAYEQELSLFGRQTAALSEIEEALLYLSQINAFRIEGGFLVLYNAMEITRLELNNMRSYKKEDYQQLKEFYDSKVQQIHIVGEYANMMVRDYNAALTFVNDYFQMEYKLFLTKYFKGARLGEIGRNITPMKYHQLFENLSAVQTEIIKDDSSKIIVTAAGPGSGKTRILVHKLASLMLMEDVKQEQLLMLTFSRTAAMEFKTRLLELIGEPAYYVEIKTFHSYCFDLLGKVGNIAGSENVIRDAVKMIQEGDVELERITKTVLVLDEAQDMDADTFGMVQALMEKNEEMRIIAVGDDDQNIYDFRNADSGYMISLLNREKACKYELLENFRSSRRVIAAANAYVKTITQRLKRNEIIPVRKEEGRVTITYVKSSLETAVVHKIEQTFREQDGQTAAVLTSTNEQAYLVAALLNKKGFRARLIQSAEKFSLCDLAEMRYFLTQLGEEAVIEDDVWNRAKEQLKRVYHTSDKLGACLFLLQKFEAVNRKKYGTDFQTYLQEVNFEDFYRADKGEICISTIHKAKGHEFDKVYMLLSEGKPQNDATRRWIYVGMTRAKNDLYICHNTHYLNEAREALTAAGVRWEQDTLEYPQPAEIELPLSHHDVWLGFFEREGLGTVIDTMRSGDTLFCRMQKYQNGNGQLFFEVEFQGQRRRVACCSKKFYDKICEQERKGYLPCEAKVMYVVKWEDKNNGEEYSILLPVLKLRRKPR